MNNPRDIKYVVGSNISKLRTASGMTQADIAKLLSYSDKAVSKWERGEAVPDISVLVNIADIFNVSVDYLTCEHDKIEVQAIGAVKKTHIQARAVITVMSLMLVWLIATLIFVLVHIANKAAKFEWLTFVYAVPITLTVWLILNTIWFNRRRNYLIITFLMWSSLITGIITFLTLGHNVAIILLLGIPGQIMIFLWSSLGYIIRKGEA